MPNPQSVWLGANRAEHLRSSSARVSEEATAAIYYSDEIKRSCRKVSPLPHTLTLFFPLKFLTKRKWETNSAADSLLLLESYRTQKQKQIQGFLPFSK